MTECFKTISEDSDCRVVIISGNGKHFTAGLDLGDLVQGDLSVMMSDGDIARKYRVLQKVIKSYQMSFTSIEQVNFFTCGKWKSGIVFVPFT